MVMMMIVYRHQLSFKYQASWVDRIGVFEME